MLKDEGFQAWFKHAESWVKTYAAFKVQLGKERSINNKWFDVTRWSKGVGEVNNIVSKASSDYQQVSIHVDACLHPSQL